MYRMRYISPAQFVREPEFVLHARDVLAFRPRDEEPLEALDVFRMRRP